jgi:gluconolactonase
VSTDFTGPNGLAFSPDEKFLYVGNWDEKRKIVYKYPANADATLGNGELFYDMTRASGEDGIDGIKVDQHGNVYVTGPGVLWIIDANGKLLGTLRGPEHPHNMAWGDADGRTLYLAAQTGIYRLRLKVPGARCAAEDSRDGEELSGASQASRTDDVCSSVRLIVDPNSLFARGVNAARVRMMRVLA